jgi:hypothetical protein
MNKQTNKQTNKKQTNKQTNKELLGNASETDNTETLILWWIMVGEIAYIFYVLNISSVRYTSGACVSFLYKKPTISWKFEGGGVVLTS